MTPNIAIITFLNVSEIKNIVKNGFFIKSSSPEKRCRQSMIFCQGYCSIVPEKKIIE
jgi:hypothetical protein